MHNDVIQKFRSQMKYELHSEQMELMNSILVSLNDKLNVEKIYFLESLVSQS